MTQTYRVLLQSRAWTTVLADSEDEAARKALSVRPVLDHVEAIEVRVYYEGRRRAAFVAEVFAAKQRERQ